MILKLIKKLFLNALCAKKDRVETKTQLSKIFHTNVKSSEKQSVDTIVKGKPMKLGEKQEAFSKYFSILLNKIHSLGWSVRIGEVWRTKEMQELYVKQGKSKTMNSRHLQKCAADIYVFCDGKQISKEQMQSLGNYWESLDSGCKWGGNFKTFFDAPHFEYAG